MKERPIHFSAPMVRAILDGSKTQTRRVVKPQPSRELMTEYECIRQSRLSARTDAEILSDCLLCPYGIPGDRLWCRETFAIVPRTAYARSEGVQQMLRPDDDHDAAIYRAGWDRSNGGFRWRPSIHMPRWASRILLEIVSVRVERLQDISEDDARAEGIERGKDFPGWYRGPLDGDSAGLAEAGRHFKIPTAFPKLAFRALWESINGPKSWAANPWVWVVEFRRVETTEGA